MSRAMSKAHVSKANVSKAHVNDARWIEPMLAQLTDPSSWDPAHPEDWAYERKLDGLRCLAVRNGDRVDLWSRNHNSFNARFPAIVEYLRALPPDSFAVDGEIVAFDGTDFAGFGALQQHGRTMAAVLCAFDMVHLLRQSTASLRLAQRKALLRKLLPPSTTVVVVEPLKGEPAGLLAYACANGWEGLIAKRRAAPYSSGRSSDWRKLKCSASQELLIGGWTEPQGARTDLGALLVGYYDDGVLRYAGKVGTGFTQATLRDLGAELRRREQPTSPFIDSVRERTAHWAAPQLVAAVSFSEWTREGRLRHPRFDGLRADKDPILVVREQRAP